ncbi:MAG: hypothetical protein WCK96_04765 [Methylococcales bacterium]
MDGIVSIDQKKSQRGTKKLTKESIIHALKPFAAWVHTITFDNGREFCKQSEIANALGLWRLLVFIIVTVSGLLLVNRLSL